MDVVRDGVRNGGTEGKLQVREKVLGKEGLLEGKWKDARGAIGKAG